MVIGYRKATSVGGDFVQSNQQNIGSVSAMFSPHTCPTVPLIDFVFGCSEKEDERIEIKTFPKLTTFVIWKMNFKGDVCSSSSYSKGSYGVDQ